IIEQCQCRCRSRRTHTLKSDLLEDLSHTVSHIRCRSEGQIHDPERNSQTLRRLAGYKLTYTGHFKSSLLDRLTEFLKSFAADFFQSFLHHSGSADPYVDHSVRLCNTEESSRHKRVVIRSVAEDDK